MENTNYTYDFFISYSFADSERVEDLCSWLENRGYKCFIAHRNMPKGVNFSDVIPWAIENSRLMIAIMTKRFDTSEHTSREVSLASDAGLPVLTVRLEKYQMTGAKKYYLNDVNWVDATVDDTNLYEEIEQAALSLIANSKRAPKSADSTPQPAAKRRRRPSRFAVSNMLVGALLVAAIVAIVVLVTNRASRGGMDINIDSVVSQGIADKMAEERHEKDSMQHRLDSLEQADMLRRAEEQQKAFHKMEVALLNASKKTLISTKN